MLSAQIYHPQCFGFLFAVVFVVKQSNLNLPKVLKSFSGEFLVVKDF